MARTKLVSRKAWDQRHAEAVPKGQAQAQDQTLALTQAPAPAQAVTERQPQPQPQGQLGCLRAGAKIFYALAESGHRPEWVAMTLSKKYKASSVMSQPAWVQTKTDRTKHSMTCLISAFNFNPIKAEIDTGGWHFQDELENKFFAESRGQSTTSTATTGSKRKRSGNGRSQSNGKGRGRGSKENYPLAEQAGQSKTPRRSPPVGLGRLPSEDTVSNSEVTRQVGSLSALSNPLAALVLHGPDRSRVLKDLKAQLDPLPPSATCVND